MKRITLLFCMAFLCSYSSSFAQIKKGEKMIGATISFLAASSKYLDVDQKEKGTQFEIAPQFGFGLGNNWIIGPSVGFSTAKLENDANDNERTETAFAAGAWVRKFHEFDTKFGIYGQFDAAAGFGKTKNNQNTNFDNKTRVISAQIRPGFYFRPSKSIVLEAVFGGIGYTSTKTDWPAGGFSDQTNNLFNFSLTEGLGLGFKVVF